MSVILDGNGKPMVLRLHLMTLANHYAEEAKKDVVPKRAKYKSTIAIKLTQFANSNAVRQLDYYGG